VEAAATVRSSVRHIHGGRALSRTCDAEDDRGGEHDEQEEWGVGEGLRASVARAQVATGSLLLGSHGGGALRSTHSSARERARGAQSGKQGERA
jgi:hypothetical protein